MPTTRMLPPRAIPRDWKFRDGGTEPGVTIRVGTRYVTISIEHARTLADQLHDLADEHEQAEP